MRQLVQGSVHTTPVTRNAKFFVIVGRKVEAVWFPHNLTEGEVKKILVDRQEILEEARMIRG